MISVRGVALAVSSSDRRYYNLEVRAPSGAALWFYGFDRNNGPLIAVEFKRNVKAPGVRGVRIATAPDSIVHDATTPKEFLKALFSIKSRGASILDRLVPPGSAHAAAEPHREPQVDMQKIVDALNSLPATVLYSSNYGTGETTMTFNLDEKSKATRCTGGGAGPGFMFFVTSVNKGLGEHRWLGTSRSMHAYRVVDEDGDLALYFNSDIINKQGRHKPFFVLKAPLPASAQLIAKTFMSALHKHLNARKAAQAAAEPQPLNGLHGAGLSWWGSHKFFITRPKLFKVNGVELGAFGPPLVARHHLSIRAGESPEAPELRFTVRTIVRKRTIEVTYARVAGNLQAEKMLCRVPESLVYPVRNEAELLKALCGIRDKRGNLVINKLINKPATAAVEPPAKFDVNGVLAALYDLVERQGHGTHRFVLGKHVVCMNAISLHRNELPVAINVLAYETGNNSAACKYVLELKDSQIDLSSSNNAWARRYETGSAKQLLQQILKDIVEDMAARYAKAATRRYGG